MLIDSHCHLTYEPMLSSLEETIKRANLDGIKFLLTISFWIFSIRQVMMFNDMLAAIFLFILGMCVALANEN